MLFNIWSEKARTQDYKYHSFKNSEGVFLLIKFDLEIGLSSCWAKWGVNPVLGHTMILRFPESLEKLE